MPIENLSNIRRLPRLGKIHMGIRVKGKETSYPRPTDYFVVPAELKEDLTALGFPEKPTKLPIMFPSEDTELVAQQWLRAYSQTQGLVCRGDGKTAVRKIDVATGAMADHTTEEWIFKENLPCNEQSCEQYLAKRCRRVMNLQFLMPTLPGIGVWQLDTSSFFSIVNINTCLDLIRRVCGRISFIPLTLSLGPKEVTPKGIKKKTVHILSITTRATIVEIAKLGQAPTFRALLPHIEEEEAPDDLFPPDVLAGAEGAVEEPPESPEETGEKSPAASVVEADVPDQKALLRHCFQLWKMQPADVRKELGGKFGNPWQDFCSIRAVKEVPPGKTS